MKTFSSLLVVCAKKLFEECKKELESIGIDINNENIFYVYHDENHEIDFVCERNGKKMYIQVAYILQNVLHIQPKHSKG